MAPDQSNQKRKRGRHAGASKNTETASKSDPKEPIEQPAIEENGEAETAPKKRGRLRKSLDSSVTEEEPSVAQEQRPEATEIENSQEAAQRKRGRPPKTQDVEPEATEEVDNSAENTGLAPKKKAGRPRRAPEEATQPVEEALDTVEAVPDAASKKRGRLAKTSVPTPEPEEEPASRQTTSPGDVAPKRRGRSVKTNGAEPEPEEEIVSTRNTPSADTVPRKRGRPARTNKAEVEEVEPTETRPRKRIRAGEGAEAQEQPAEKTERTRGRNKSVNAESEDQEMTGPDGQPGRRGRPSKNDEPTEDTTREAEPSGKGKAKGKATKNAPKPTEKPGKSAQQPESEGRESEGSSGRRMGKGHLSANDGTSTKVTRGEKEAQNKSQGKHGRPTLAEVSVPNTQNTQTNDPQPEKQSKKRGPRRPSLESNGASTAPPKPNEKEKEPQRRRRSSPEPSQNEGEKAPVDPLATANYRHLASRTRHVHRSVIAAKWTPLNSAAINTIDALVRDAYIPVLERLANRDAKYAQAQTILRTFTNRLHAKLVKGMPFPPSSATGLPGTGGKNGASAREIELNFEKVIDASAQLQKQLDPLLHSVALLQSEKEREEAKLQADYKALRELEGNAKAQARGWRERGKRSHALAPERRDVDAPSSYQARSDEDTAMTGIEVVTAAKKDSRGNVFRDVVLKETSGEEELLGLAKQIGSHMESMRGNLGQIEGVVPAIQKGRAALQGVLARHLSEEAYEAVVLG